ncbi:DUF4012 domain-containing protein [Plantibacter sp. YIM 135249]|uniref:DUF4012 domain-containing protein n=1 Tax=Plantibacter sp. YIM 135249 TaxID=3423918 RepID=UPI003D33576E
MTAASPASGRARSGPRGNRRRRVFWIVAAVLLILVAAGAWLGVRAVMAKNSLERAQTVAAKVQRSILAGDADAAKAQSAALRLDTAKAVGLTSDPVWRAAEFVPFLGGNFSAVREAADATDRIAVDVVPKIVDVTGQVNLASLMPGNGSIETAPLAAAAPAVAEASAAASRIDHDVQAIDASGTIPIVEAAVTKLQGTIGTTTEMLDAAARATALLPAMLGGDGPRNYLVMIQNNAEVRSSGGIAGATALVHAENGAISLVRTASSDEFRKQPSPILPLTPFEQNVYTDNLGEYIQDTNLTVDFSRTGELAGAMAEQVFGTPIDGVIAIDPSVLANLLTATGPVTLTDGTVLNHDNAVQLLLSEVYARYPDRLVQDAFFAEVAGSVFTTMTASTPDPKTLIEALAASGAENRLHVWSAHEQEQAALAETSLAGIPPTKDTDAVYTGVYLEDLTRGKMDYYLDTRVVLSSPRCTPDGAEYTVAVTMTSNAPADAATSLPAYVTADGIFGTPPGDIATRVVLHGPLAASLLRANDGKDLAVKAVTDPTGRLYAQTDVTLEPGESKRLEFTVRAPKASEVPPKLVTTPGITGKIGFEAFPACAS